MLRRFLFGRTVKSSVFPTSVAETSVSASSLRPVLERLLQCRVKLGKGRVCHLISLLSIAGVTRIPVGGGALPIGITWSWRLLEWSSPCRLWEWSVSVRLNNRQSYFESLTTNYLSSPGTGLHWIANNSVVLLHCNSAYDYPSTWQMLMYPVSLLVDYNQGTFEGGCGAPDFLVSLPLPLPPALKWNFV